MILLPNYFGDLFSGAAMGWAWWAKSSGPPSAGAPEFQAKNVHVGETFNRFADFGL